MGGGGKGGSEYPVHDYRMSIHYGICHGELDAVNLLKVKEKTIWCGGVTADSTVVIDKPDLFGGDKKEGGVKGRVEVYMGSPTQVMSEEVAGRVGRTSATMPGYRNLANLFFRGSGGKGFLWTTNNPYLPGAWAHVSRIGTALSTTYSKIFQAPVADTITLPFPDLYLQYTGNTYTEIDLTSYAESIDLGTAIYSGGYTCVCTLVPLAGGGPSSGVWSLDADPYDEFGVKIGSGWHDQSNQTGGDTMTITETIPVGTRTIRVYGNIVNTLVLFAIVDVPSRGSTVVMQALGKPICGDTIWPGAPPDMNPAHIIYECLVETEWGRGVDPAAIDTASFDAAALALFNEKFGLSIQWAKQTDIESFIEDILDHIQASLFAHPRTGLLTLKLFRDDYDVNTLDLLDESNSHVTKFQRKTWAETTNEINVTWTNPENEQEETVTFHDLANISIQGGIVSDTRDYHGVRNAALANFIGGRDIRSASTPLATATVQASRAFWQKVPGDVVKLKSPEDGVELIVVRIAKIDRARSGKMPVTLTVTEDIFGLESSEFSTTTDSLWEDTDSDPEEYTNLEIQTAPRNIMLAAGVDATDENDPRVMTIVMGEQNSVDNTGFDLLGPSVLANGDPSTQVRGTFSPTDYGETVAILPQEEQTVVPAAFYTAFVGSTGPELATLILIGSGEGEHELVMLDSYDGGLDEWTLARGMLDTVPKEWPVGTPIWFLNNNFSAVDSYEMTSIESFDYKVLPRTSLGVLAEADATAIPFTTSERPYMPFRPANVTVQGTLWDDTVLDAGVDVILTWANRDRFTEDSVLTRWTEANVTPEVGQTVVVVQTDMADNVLAEYPGLTGTGATFDLFAAAAPTGVRFNKLKFYSERDGIRSLQAVERVVELNLLGYGHNYGRDYGENDG